VHFGLMEPHLAPRSDLESITARAMGQQDNGLEISSRVFSGVGC
jgi:hypothetical protein